MVAKWRKRKRKLTAKQAQYVDELTNSVLDLLLEFKLKSDITNYLVQKAVSDWRQIEYDLDKTYPVKAQGVIFRKWEPMPGGPLVEQTITSEKAVEYLGAFPLEAAGINYVFTLVEMYGDLIVQKTNAKFFKKKRRQTNWHHKVYGDANTENHEIQIKMANGFGEPLLVDGANVDSDAVLKLVELKRARNAFAHEGDVGHRFDVLFGYAIDVICEMYFLLREDEWMLIVTPFKEDAEVFEEAREEKTIIEGMDLDEE